MRPEKYFRERNVLLGVCGSIAAHRAIDLASQLVAQGAEVRVLMTGAAQRFVTPLPFRAITGHGVVAGLFDEAAPQAVPHVELAAKADLFCIAPATATTIARLAAGLADDAISATFLTTRAPVLVCPAMNTRMWEHRQVQENLSRLRAMGAAVVEPVAGRLACGEMGPGRLAAVCDILEAMRAALTSKDLVGVQVLVSSGPTREPLDAVRFLSNPSTGRMGHALALAAARRGARVTLVSGPTGLGDPPGVEVVRVMTAQQMHDAVMARLSGADALVMAAAVADFRPKEPQRGKLPKARAVGRLELELCPDVLAAAAKAKGPAQVVVGFAAETEEPVERGFAKLKRKGLDLIVVNDITVDGAGFGAQTNLVRIIDPKGNSEELPLMHKELVSERIWDRVIALLRRGGERR